ncbi:TPA: hypothetical protein U0576_002022 [Streptococcus suis]|nr:hypothetical protein [Streptococcus suis]
MSILTLLFSFPIPIMIALAINEVRIQWIKKTIQTVSYLPYFISWVIVANIIITFLSSDGIVNSLLQMIGASIIHAKRGIFLVDYGNSKYLEEYGL